MTKAAVPSNRYGRWRWPKANAGEDGNDKHAAYRDFVADLKAARAAAGKAPAK